MNYKEPTNYKPLMNYKELFNEFVNGIVDFPDIADLNKWINQREELNELMRVLDVLKELKITEVKDAPAIVISGVFTGENMRIIKKWQDSKNEDTKSDVES